MKKYFIRHDAFIFEAGKFTEKDPKCMTGESTELTFEEFSNLKNNFLLDMDNLTNLEVMELEEKKSNIYIFEEWDNETEESEIYFTLSNRYIY